MFSPMFFAWFILGLIHLISDKEISKYSYFILWIMLLITLIEV